MKDSHEDSRKPLGQFQDRHGLRTYVVGPPSESEENSEKINTIILLTNVFGPDYIHNQLVADEWAKEGFKVVVPDLLEGDPLPNGYVTVSPGSLNAGGRYSSPSLIRINGTEIRPLHLMILDLG